MMQKLVLGIVILLIFSTVTYAIATGYTSETRYATSPSISVKRDIVFSSNRYGQTYVKPYGGFGAKGASRGSFGAKGEEEGASNLPYGDWIPQGQNPQKFSNYYASARGYQILNKYIELNSADLTLVSRPQINGTPMGYARLISIKDQDVGLPMGQIFFRSKDLPPLDPLYLYEAWLVDEDTGYPMSIGLFQPAAIGRITSLELTISTPLTAFDSMMVTVEPFPDDDPTPGPVILEGSINVGSISAP